MVNKMPKQTTITKRQRQVLEALAKNEDWHIAYVPDHFAHLTGEQQIPRKTKPVKVREQLTLPFFQRLLDGGYIEKVPSAEVEQVDEPWYLADPHRYSITDKGRAAL